MWKFYLLICLAALSFSCGNKNASVKDQVPVRLILDTDLGPDYDDVGAMALMYALADSGQVNVLATLSSNRDERVIPCIEVLNTYFNHPEMPVGVTKNTNSPSLTTWHKKKWTDVLPQKYPYKTEKTSDAPDAVKVYRKVLSEQPDTSVVICTIGFLTNLKDLLLSEPDEYSPFSGLDLVKKKVKKVISMAGEFPQGREFNVYSDAASARFVAERWPTEIIFSGGEIGSKIFTGKRLVSMDVENNPVKEAYSLCFAEGDPDGRMSWDLTAVLVAIKGYDPYYDVEHGFFRVIDDEGANDWTPDSSGHHLRLIEKLPPSQMADIIERYMMYVPDNRMSKK